MHSRAFLVHLLWGTGRERLDLQRRDERINHRAALAVENVGSSAHSGSLYYDGM